MSVLKGISLKMAAKSAATEWMERSVANILQKRKILTTFKHRGETWCVDDMEYQHGYLYVTMSGEDATPVRVKLDIAVKATAVA